MSDAISRSTVLDALEAEKALLMEQNEGSWPFTGKILTRAVDTVHEFVKDLPALDVAPVVRCKDCKHRFTRICPMFFEEHTYSDGEGYYWVDHDRTTDNGFCDEGERMDGEAE